MCTGCLKTNSLTATVATRPRARRLATEPPAMSTCDMIQPPKMSPFWFASAGIGMTRSAGCLPSGSLSMREIVQRPAPERREAGAEDEAGVGEVGVGDDAFLDRALRLGEIGRDQPLDQLRPVGIALAFDRLAFFPAVDALAGFLSELAGVHLVLQEPRYRHIAGRFGERFAGVQADVEAHRVGQLRRAHGHAELFHRGVDRLGLHASAHQAKGFLHIRPEDAIPQEAGRILTGSGSLSIWRTN